MSIFLSYNRLVGAYIITMANLQHNHPVGAFEFSLYATERRPADSLRQTAEALLQNGANPTLVTSYLNQRDAPVRPRDVYNIKQHLNYRGELHFYSFQIC